MHIVYTDQHKAHDTEHVLIEGQPLDSFDVPARAETILEAVRSAQLGAVLSPKDHGLAPILAVHDPDYIEFLRNAYAESAAYFGEAGPVSAWVFAVRHAIRKPQGFMARKGYYAFGWGTPILEGTWEAAYWSAQCALTAAGLVLEGQRAAYALCRPPGHHVGADLYGGYCYLNNAAIATRFLQGGAGRTPAPPAVPRVAILDIDYHHGNGTQIIFYSDPTVLYCSLHAHPDEEYPYYWGDAEERGIGEGEGTNRNWPLPRGTGDQAYLATLEEAIATIRGFDPAYLVLSTGLDLVEGDPQGGFSVSSEGVREIGKRIAGLDIATVLVQEGGYRLDTLGENAVALLRPFSS